MDSHIQQQMIEPIDFGRKISDGIMLLRVLTLSLSTLVAITILQDFIHSQLKGYSFYFTESLLFKVFWVLFLPLVFLQLAFLKKAKSETIWRVTLAVSMPMLIHLLSLPIIVWGLSALFYSHTYSYYQILAYTISEDFYKLLLIYGLFVFAAKFLFGGKQVGIKEITELPSLSFAETKTGTEEGLKARSAVLDKIVVSNGRNYTPIPVNDILYFGAATPYIEIQLENKRYLHNETLKAINEKLDKKQFVRIHKSTIVNLKKVVSYKSRLNGDYDLLLENKSEIRLSRNYAAEFKELFNRLSTGQETKSSGQPTDG